MWLGNMYYTGDGVQQSEAEAARWYRLAADQGYPEAQHRLGLILSRGREGILQDHQSALELFRAAAAQGDGPAQHSLSRMYSEGLAVPADPLQAYVWANLAVHSGNLLAADHRDQVAQRLTPAQLLNAQAISRRCLETDYREC
jgi:TPR repeat protein